MSILNNARQGKLQNEALQVVPAVDYVDLAKIFWFRVVCAVVLVAMLLPRQKALSSDGHHQSFSRASVPAECFSGGVQSSMSWLMTSGLCYVGRIT